MDCDRINMFRIITHPVRRSILLSFPKVFGTGSFSKSLNRLLSVRNSFFQLSGNNIVLLQNTEVPLGAVTEYRRYGDRPLAVEGPREIES
jgi:hypothetical protein